MSDLHINFIYPVHITILAMLLLLLVFGACYTKAYRIHREGERMSSKTVDRAASCPLYHHHATAMFLMHRVLVDVVWYFLLCPLLGVFEVQVDRCGLPWNI